MNTTNDTLLEKKAALEDALEVLENAQKQRMRAEGQYEAAMETLKRLGFDSIQGAKDAYAKQSAELQEEIALLLDDVQTFDKEFQEAFNNVLND